MFISLKNKIIFAIIPLTIIFLTIFSASLYYGGKKSIEKKSMIFIDVIIKSKAKEIGLKMREISKDMMIIAESKDLKKIDFSSKEFINYLERVEEINKDSYEIIFVSDLKGNTVTSKRMKSNILDRDYFKNITNKNSNLEVSDPVISKTLNKPGFVVSVPIKNINGDIIGLVGGVALLEKISKSITDINLGEKGYSGIINKNGVVIAHTDKKNIMKLNMFNVFNKNIKNFDRKKMSNSGQFWYNENGKGNYVTYYTIPNTDGWIIGINMYEKELYREIHNMLYALIAMSFILITMLSITFYFMIKKATKPLKKLTEAVKSFSENRVLLDIKIDSRDEVEELYDAFNKMSKTIIKHTHELEDIINEQTEELYNVNRKLLAQNSELEYLNDSLKGKNDDLYKLATKDSLTGLYNRYELYRRIDGLIAKSIRGKDVYFSVLLIDLDNFKYYNDTLGHDAGDEVLRRVAGVLNTVLRENDIIVRYGGDEFVIVVEEKIENALIVGNKILIELKKHDGFQKELSEKYQKKIEIIEEKKLMCSIGIYEYERNLKLTPAEMIKKADIALYKSKKSGKGRVEVVRE